MPDPIVAVGRQILDSTSELLQNGDGIHVSALYKKYQSCH